MGVTGYTIAYGLVSVDMSITHVTSFFKGPTNSFEISEIMTTNSIMVIKVGAIIL